MCAKCNGKGKVVSRKFSGVWVFKACDCSVAKENEANYEARKNKILEELKRKREMYAV